MAHAHREVALLTNPHAGRGRGSRTAAVALPRLRDAGLRVHHLVGRDADEARELAARSVRDGVDSLVVVGGDGMAHLAAQAIVTGSGEWAPSLGIIPAGTGNDVARSLGIPRADPQLAADVVVGGQRRRIDLARCGSTHFVTVMAAGFDSRVNERADAMRWPRGRARYNLATLRELRVLAPAPYTLDLDGQERRVDAVVVAVGNGPSYGGGLRIAEGASLDDGLLDVVVIGDIGRLDLLRTFPRLYTGSHTRHPRFERHRVRRVSIAAPRVTAYADGERVGTLPLTVEAVPGAIEVLVPHE